ncbi:hypothetical protein PALB_13120 [Pseudoalteromonas luteoviolacea B = ATCC 29581]|nr:hypothetical protein PALB_13120 [Pseudoalteromonas luteoviolacea B = ATCC 29581]
MQSLSPLLFIFLLISPHTIDASEIVVNDPDWPPYFFKGESYQPIGFAKEVLQLCIAKTPYQANFIYHPIKRMRNYMENGKLDVHVYSYKENRDAFLLFGKEPIFKTSYRPFVNKKAAFEIDSLDDFRGLRIGHLQGLKYSKAYFDYIENSLDKGYVRSVTANVDLLTLLRAQKVDVFVNTVDTVYWLATTMGMRDEIHAVDFDIQTKDYFVTVSKKSGSIENKKAFLETIDTCIRELKQNGQYQKIRSGYGI